MPKLLSASLLLALAAPLSASAATPLNTPSEIQLLRREIESMRAAYEARLQALEQRLVAAERVAATPPPATADAALATPAAAAPVAAASVGGANAFNPAMSLILSGGYTGTSRDPASYHLS